MSTLNTTNYMHHHSTVSLIRKTVAMCDKIGERKNSFYVYSFTLKLDLKRQLILIIMYMVKTD